MQKKQQAAAHQIGDEFLASSLILKHLMMIYINVFIESRLLRCDADACSD
jgi:hypothetical protein